MPLSSCVLLLNKYIQRSWQTAIIAAGDVYTCAGIQQLILQWPVCCGDADEGACWGTVWLRPKRFQRLRRLYRCLEVSGNGIDQSIKRFYGINKYLLIEINAKTSEEEEKEEEEKKNKKKNNNKKKKMELALTYAEQ